jgi:heme exporter protein A
MNRLTHAELKAEQLECIRDDRSLFRNLSFSVQSGQALLLEGGNGCGKTSLLRILCGFREPDAGALFWCGQAIRDSDFLVRMAYVGHADGLKKELTVLENLRFAQAMRSGGCMDIEQALATVQMSGYDDNRVQTLSAGQKRRITLARLLLSDSALWILDEPLTALDRRGIALVESLLVEHIRRGGMAILTSHQDISQFPVDLQRIHLDSCR